MKLTHALQQTVKSTALAGLAALAFAACSPQKPEVPAEFPAEDVVYHSNAGYMWIFRDLDKNSKTYELAIRQSVSGTFPDSVTWEVLYAPGFEKAAQYEHTSRSNIHVMTPAEQNQVNTFANGIVTFENTMKKEQYLRNMDQYMTQNNSKK